MRGRAARVLEAVGCDAFVASDPFTVAWLTGFAADETWGPNPFAARTARGRALRRLRRRHRQRGRGAGARGQRLRGRGLRRASPPARSTSSPRGARRSPRSGLRGRVAVEDGALPVPGVEAVQADAHALRLLRAVKDDDEIARIRAAIGICDAGQAAARSALRAGVSELEAWGGVQAAMEVAAGERLSLLCDFATGERSAEIGGPPTPRIVQRGRPRDRRPRAAPGGLLRRLLLDARHRRRTGGGARGARALPRGARGRARCARAGGRGGRARCARAFRPRLPAPHRPRHRRGAARGAAHRARTAQRCWLPA